MTTMGNVLNVTCPAGASTTGKTLLLAISDTRSLSQNVPCLHMYRRFGYERQVMPKDQKKKRKQAGSSATGASGAAATSSQAAPSVCSPASR